MRRNKRFTIPAARHAVTAMRSSSCRDALSSSDNWASLVLANVHTRDCARDDEALNLASPFEDGVDTDMTHISPDHGHYIVRVDLAINKTGLSQTIMVLFRTLIVGLLHAPQGSRAIYELGQVLREMDTDMKRCQSTKSVTVK